MEEFAFKKISIYYSSSRDLENVDGAMLCQQEVRSEGVGGGRG